MSFKREAGPEFVGLPVIIDTPAACGTGSGGLHMLQSGGLRAALIACMGSGGPGITFCGTVPAHCQILIFQGIRGPKHRGTAAASAGPQRNSAAAPAAPFVGAACHRQKSENMARQIRGFPAAAVGGMAAAKIAGVDGMGIAAVAAAEPLAFAVLVRRSLSLHSELAETLTNETLVGWHRFTLFLIE